MTSRLYTDKRMNKYSRIAKIPNGHHELKTYVVLGIKSKSSKIFHISGLNLPLNLFPTYLFPTHTSDMV